MPDQSFPCLCSRHPHRRFYGDHPRDFPEMVVDAADLKDPPSWTLHCRQCGMGWMVSAIPYGGIYGDFEWERIEA